MFLERHKEFGLESAKELQALMEKMSDRSHELFCFYLRKQAHHNNLGAKHSWVDRNGRDYRLNAIAEDHFNEADKAFDMARHYLRTAPQEETTELTLAQNMSELYR